MIQQQNFSLQTISDIYFPQASLTKPSSSFQQIKPAIKNLYYNNSNIKSNLQKYSCQPVEKKPLESYEGINQNYKPVNILEPKQKNREKISDLTLRPRIAPYRLSYNQKQKKLNNTNLDLTTSKNFVFTKNNSLYPSSMTLPRLSSSNYVEKKTTKVSK